ncbi:MAG: DUF6273 domain-containing protein, partial [Firmicutes bacterium]|nr:DUF6273 domain-containing protein [Bacillota bacterium]
LAKPQPTAVNNPKPTKPQPATVSNPQPQKPQPTAVSNPQPQKPQPTAVSNPQPQKPQPAAFSNPKPTKPPKNKHSPKVGDIITFSNYEWRILHVQNKQALLLSDLVLETRPYNIKNTAITWEKCSLRYYLNNDFYNKLSDKSQITQKTIVNDDHPEYGIFGGNRTTDRIFLLSLEEVVNYFGNGNSDMSILKNDGYISDKNNSKRIARDTSGAAAWWWLRSPGYFSGIASFVSNGGVVNVIHYSVSVVGGVRPALWINL